MHEGFFTRAEASGKLPTRSALKAKGVRPVEQLHLLGVDGVKGMNPKAENPNLQPSGKSSPDVYVLAGYPSKQDDAEGTHLAGDAGRLLREVLAGLRLRFDYVCRTHPPKREPTWEEIECFRPSVTRSIEEAKPKVVLALGNEALVWALPGLPGGVHLARGRIFQALIGTHPCYVVACAPPATILFLSKQDRKTRVGGIPAEEVVRVWKQDLTDLAESLPGTTPAAPIEPSRVKDGVRLCMTPPEMLDGLRSLRDSKILALDVEGNALRPYAKGARMLSIALSDGKRTVALPIGHSFSSVYRNKEDATTVLRALADLLRSVGVLVAHNAPFDLEWMISLLTYEPFQEVRLHCTQAQGFILDERKGALSLDYLCRQHLGLPLKSLSSLDVTNLENEPLKAVLLYNALDAKHTALLHRIQYRMIKEQGLLDAYRMQIRRVPTLALTQREGLLIDVQQTRKFEKDYALQLQEAEQKAKALPEVREFERTRGPFRISAQQDVRKVLGGAIKDGESADKDALEGIDSPLAKIILEHRRIAKLKGTYVDRFLPEHKKTYVYPDGRAHCAFNPTVAETGRLSSDNPNNQNWPKRGKGKEVRRQVIAPPDHYILSVDYKQLEAWVIALVSQDRRFMEAIRTGYDVHMFWAEKIFGVYPKAIKPYSGDLKAFRSAIKNQWVFPAFFGSSYRSRAAAIGLPEELAQMLDNEFWAEFRGVKAWQRATLAFYERNGYVEGITGRRRRGPLGYNQIINTPIQGPASDIVVNAMCRLSEMARTRKAPAWAQPVLNIHDDLTFYAPKSVAPEKAAKSVARVMTDTSMYPWATLPLSVEAEAGTNWYEMQTVGVFKGEEHS